MKKKPKPATASPDVITSICALSMSDLRHQAEKVAELAKEDVIARPPTQRVGVTTVPFDPVRFFLDILQERLLQDPHTVAGQTALALRVRELELAQHRQKEKKNQTRNLRIVRLFIDEPDSEVARKVGVSRDTVKSVLKRHRKEQRKAQKILAAAAMAADARARGWNGGVS
jgi:hypothetical protein